MTVRGRLSFDRGTLLFEGPPRGSLGGLAPLAWDERVEAHRAPAHLYPAVVAGLRRGGVAFADEVIPPRPLLAPWCRVELRPYQEAALAAWQLAGRRGIVVLPTGSGKTRLALAALSRLGATALCLAPTRALVEQWAAELRRVYAGPIGYLADGRRELGAITVATYESGYRWMDRIGNAFDLLVVDEAHHFGGGTRDEALEMCTAAARLGLTATPRDTPEALVRLDGLLGPIVFELGIDDLAGAYLAELIRVTLGVSLTPAERAAYDASMAAFHGVRAAFEREVGQASWEALVRWAGRTREGRAGMAALSRARRLLAYPAGKRRLVGELLGRHQAARVLVFTADNDTAYAIARDHLIMPLTCDIGRRERQASLGRFSRGELRALVSARVLNEGIDVPDADVAIVVGGTHGAREHVQRIGRLLRPASGKRAVVYELVVRGSLEVGQARRRGRTLAP